MIASRLGLRRMMLVGIASLIALVGVFALSAAAARAEAPKLISYGHFETGEYPFGIAVDNSGLASAGDIYVTGLAGSKINKYDTTGKLISPPSPFGEGSERYSGAAVSPTNGDVYVVDAGAQAIDTYAPSSGALLSSFSVSGCANVLGSLTWVAIASDAAGNVYLPCAPEDTVRKYSPAGVLLQTLEGSGGSALKGPTSVAVDTSGNVWVGDAGDNRIEEFSPSGTVEGAIKSEGVRDVAVDKTGDILALVNNSADFCGSYTPPCYHLVEYSTTGQQVADVGAGSIPSAGFYERYGETDTLAVNESDGHVYVVDAGNERVWIWGPPTAPTIGRELAAEVGTSEAKLGALASPGGIPTTYRFEYGTTAAYGHSTPYPEGSVGEGLASRTVWASASGLAPGTTYHYRVVVSNELGTVAGPDQTFTTETAAAAECPNEELRSGFSASLPDCRAYELVTPATAASSQPGLRPVEAYGLAARNGERLAFNARDIFPGSDSGGADYLATRSPGGWTSESVDPRQSYTGDRCTSADTGAVAYSPNLTSAVVFVGGEQTAYYNDSNTREGGCGVEGLEVVSGEPANVENLLLRDAQTGAYELIDEPRAGVVSENARFQGASQDFAHVIFDEEAPLTPEAVDGVDNLYEWTKGEGLRLVTVLPNGTPVSGQLAGDWKEHQHVISADGSKILFTAEGKLYDRIDHTGTVQIDASQAGGPGGGGRFREASADGGVVYFTDDASAGLTSDTAAGSGTNLYRYELATGKVTDITPGGAGAEVEIWGASEDGSYLYFASEESLLSGAVAGEHNIYLWHAGKLSLVVSGAGYGACEGSCSQPVSGSGRFLAFTTTKSITGYDNTNPNTGGFVNEVYLYDATANALECVSCQPSGAPPSAGGATLEKGKAGLGAPHPVTNEGRVFFDTKEALAPRDTNGTWDVYEYESHEPRLITTGTSGDQSRLVDVSEEGRDVFFITRQQLAPQDTHETARVIYDARVDGGIAMAESRPPCTTSDACRAPVSPQPSIYGSPSSQTFSGVGNVTPSRSSMVKPRALTRAQKLARTLRSCRKRFRHAKKKQRACVRRARRKFGPVKKRTGKNARLHGRGK